MRARGLLLASALAASGCATVLHGPYQTVEVTSDPSGAKVRVLPSGAELVTPAEVWLRRKHIHTLVFELEGHREGAEYVDRERTDLTTWNLFLGGLVGLFIDEWVGSDFRLRPAAVHVVLEPEPTAASPGTASDVVSTTEMQPL